MNRPDTARKTAFSHRASRRLMLFIVSGEQNSLIVQENLNKLLETEPDFDFDLQVIDILQETDTALEYSVLVTPCLIQVDPPPQVTIIGTLSDMEKVRAALQLQSGATDRESHDAEGQAMLDAMRRHEVDAVIGTEDVIFLRLRRIEQQLRESEARYRTLIESSPSFVFEADVDGGLKFSSRGYHEYTGTTYDDVAGWAWRDKDIVHPDDLPLTTERWAHSVETGEPFEMEVRVRRHDGAYQWHLNRFVPNRDPSGNIIAWIGTSTNIDDRKRTEQELRKSERKYRSLFDSIDEGFCIIEVIFDRNDKPVDYRFLDVNPAFERQTGLVDATGKTIRELVPGHEEHWFETYGRIARTGEPARFEDRAEQLHRWYDVYAWRYGGLEDNQVAVLFNDISERKRTEQELENANAMKDQFLGLVSHELRTPIATIVANSSLLNRRGDALRDEDRRQALADIGGEAQRLQNIIENLLILTRVEHNRLLKFQPFRLDEVIQERVEAFSHQNSARDVEFVNEGGPCVVYGESGLAAVLIDNLTSNAHKYSPPQVPIEIILTHCDDNTVEVCIRDHGIGIDESELPRLFEQFYRARSGRQYSKGMGLGLTTCKRIVDAHDGRIWAKVRPEGGTDFVFSLARHPSPTESTE